MIDIERQDADIEEMFAFADTDGDGSLSFQEFEVHTISVIEIFESFEIFEIFEIYEIFDIFEVLEIFEIFEILEVHTRPAIEMIMAEYLISCRRYYITLYLISQFDILQIILFFLIFDTYLISILDILQRIIFH